MRAGRAILLGLAGLLALLVAGIWVLPGMLDWNRYRDSIAALATSGFGRPVRIGGGVTLHLLPQPILTATGIEVDDAGDGIKLSARELRLRVALGPLLGGRVDARELTLRGADLRLPWPPPPGALAQRPPDWLTGLQARLEESRLQVGGLVLSDLAASLATDPDTGTLSTAGSATMGGRDWKFTARLARPGRDGSAGLEASLDGQGPLRDTGGTFSGQIGRDGALSGRVAGRGPDLSQLTPAPAVAWRGDGRLSAAAGLAVADELALEIGGSPARGAIALRVQPQARLDLALAVGRLDLDAWLPVLMRGAQGAAAGLPTGLDLSAEAATLAGGTLRRLRGAFDLDAGGVSIRDAAASLPGEAQLTLSGRVPANARGPLFEGTARLAAPDLRTTLRWLEPLAPQLLAVLPAGTMRAADLSAKLLVEPGQASLSELRGSLDGSRLEGGLSLRTGARLTVAAGLSLDRLVLDPWLAQVADLAIPAQAQAALAKAAAFDLELKLQARQATWRGAGLGQLSVDAQTEAGRLTLRRLEATPLGIRVTGSGTLGEGGRVTEGRLELSTQDLAPLRALVPPDMALAGVLAPGLLRGAGSLLLTLSGPPDALAARAALDLGDLRIEAQPTVNLPQRRIAGPLMLHHPGAPRLLELLGLPGTAAWLGDGSFSLVTQLAASKGRVELGNLDLAAGSLRASGTLALANRTVSGQVAMESLPLPMPYFRSPETLPVELLRGWQAAVKLDAEHLALGLTPVLDGVSTEIALGGGVLRLNRIGAKLGGGMLGGTLVLDASGDMPRLSVQAKATGIAVAGPVLARPLDLDSGTLDAQASLSGEGYSPAALLATLAGEATLFVRDGVASGFDAEAAMSALDNPDHAAVTALVRAALLDGSTSFARLDLPLTLRRGQVSGTGQFTLGTGTASVTGNLDLAGGGLDVRLSVQPGGGRPELAVRLAGPAAQTVRTPELAGLARWLAEQP